MTSDKKKIAPLSAATRPAPASKPDPAPAAGHHLPEFLVCVLLAATTLAVYAHVCNNGFVYDDMDYVVNNPHVKRGLSGQAVLWAFTTFHSANWHPLTWLSLQLDASLFGPQPWGYHLHNLLLHTANTLLLFVVLRVATGAVWRSALVAALFTLHPLHVESVAWVAERKDVLSAFFWMLTLLAYVAYAQRPALGRYLLVLLAFALGLLAKPMLVTLPCVLLLLDYWPLRRLRPEAASPATNGRKCSATSWHKLLWEKVPFVVLAAASCVVTVLAQRASDTAPSLEALPLPFRISNALAAYGLYLRKTFWPADLAVYYPYVHLSFWDWSVLLGAVLLLVTTALAVRLRRQAPYFLVGWLWYLGTLVPVIGLVQVGAQALGDRYTYLPLIGIFLALVWGLTDLTARYRCEWLGTVGAAVALVACVLVSWLQVHYWQDEVSLWTNALQVDANNPVAYDHLGSACLKAGELDKAQTCFLNFLHLEPNRALAHARMGMVLASRGQWEDAGEFYKKALELDRTDSDAHRGLGVRALLCNQLGLAKGHFQEALRLRPESALLHHDLGLVHEYEGAWQEALASYRQATELDPGSALYHRELALALWECGQTALALAEYRECSRLAPEWIAQANTQARGMATDRAPQRRNGLAALHLARQVCQATEEKEPAYLDTLAAAHAELSQFDKAVVVTRQALDLALAGGDTNFAGQMRQRLDLYETRQPLRQGSPAAAP